MSLRGKPALPALPKKFKAEREIKQWLGRAKKEIKKLPKKGKFSYERTAEGHNVVRWEVISADDARDDLIAALLALERIEEAAALDPESDALDLHRLRGKANANELTAAVELLDAIEPGRPRDAAAIELALILVPRGEVDAALELVGAISEERTRADGLAKIAAAVAPRDLERAGAIVETISTPAGMSRAKLAIITQHLAGARLPEARALIPKLLPHHQPDGVEQLTLYQLRGKGWEQARAEVARVEPPQRGRAWFQVGRALAEAEDFANANRALERALVEVARAPRQQLPVCLQIAALQEGLGDLTGAVRTVELGLAAAQSAPPDETEQARQRLGRDLAAAGPGLAAILARGGYHDRAVAAAGTIETVQGRRAAYQQIAIVLGVEDAKAAGSFMTKFLERPDFGAVFRGVARRAMLIHQPQALKRWQKQAKEPQHRFQIAVGSLAGLAELGGGR